jgi:hypothetical protein
MDLNYISGESWKEFREKYPTAYGFLLSASLDGEYAYLASLAELRQRLTDWQLARYQELRQLRVNTGKEL